MLVFVILRYCGSPSQKQKKQPSSGPWGQLGRGIRDLEVNVTRPELQFAGQLGLLKLSA